MRIFARKIKPPRMPWWTADTIKAVEGILGGFMNVFEWGSGSSTVWLAARVKRVYSVEHDKVWKQKIRKWARREKARGKISLVTTALDSDRYCDHILRFKKNFDFIVIDGRNRVECFKRAVRKVAPGCYIMVDDTERPRYRPIYDFKEVVVFKEIEPDSSGKKATIFRRLF